MKRVVFYSRAVKFTVVFNTTTDTQNARKKSNTSKSISYKEKIKIPEVSKVAQYHDSIISTQKIDTSEMTVNRRDG